MKNSTAIIDLEIADVKISKQSRGFGSIIAKTVLVVYLVFMLIYMAAPAIVVSLSSFSTTKFLTFPPVGFTTEWYRVFFANDAFVQSLGTSIKLAACATAISMILGTMAAVAMDRFQFRGRNLIQALLMAPISIPMLVTGVAMLQFFANLGIARGFLLLLIGHILITAPYVTRTIGAALAGFNRSYEEAARNLGASPLRAFLEITLPNIKAGLVGAAIFAFITSFANLTLTVFIGGPRDATLPVRLWGYIEFSYDPVITTIATIIFIITVILLILLSRVASLEKIF